MSLLEIQVEAGGFAIGIFIDNGWAFNNNSPSTIHMTLTLDGKITFREEVPGAYCLHVAAKVDHGSSWGQRLSTVVWTYETIPKLRITYGKCFWEQKDG